MPQVKPGDFVRHDKNEVVVKVVNVSENGDLVVEHPNGVLTVCKANELRIVEDEVP